MAEKVIKNNQSLVPFFGERLSFIKGLDPLGLQNTSDATFSMLLPGLNNVTDRIRYYSFYCWLLDQYSKQNGNTNPKNQQQFIRRAEYIIALASSYLEGDATSIPGSSYASRQITNDSSTVHNLQAGTFQANGSTTDTYWKYHLGAFGQYYLGSLSDIGLVSRRDKTTGIYVRSNNRANEFISGEALAEAFEANIDARIKTLFFDCLNKGEISEGQLVALTPYFNLTQVPSGTDEQKLLLSILLQKDYPLRIEEEPSIHRSTTIKYLIKYVKDFVKVLNERSFIYHCYSNKGRISNESNNTTIGWYYYQFNEYWHYGNTAIFNGILTFLEDTVGPDWETLKSFLDLVTYEIVKDFKNQGLIKSEKDSLSSLLDTLEPDEQEFLEACRINYSIHRASNGFLLLFSQYLNQHSELMALKAYSENNGLGKDGEGTSYFITEFGTKMETTIEQFIFEYLYKHIIYRHQYVALRKMGSGVQSTQKFIIEGYHIRYLGNFEPGFTGPRIGNLIAYFKDLGVMNVDSTLTEEGISLLFNLTHDNN